MPQDDMKPPHNSPQETDPNTTTDLAKEMIRSLDAESAKRMEKIGPEDKSPEKGVA